MFVKLHLNDGGELNESRQSTIRKVYFYGDLSEKKKSRKLCCRIFLYFSKTLAQSNW